MKKLIAVLITMISTVGFSQNFYNTFSIEEEMKRMDYPETFIIYSGSELYYTHTDRDATYVGYEADKKMTVTVPSLEDSKIEMTITGNFRIMVVDVDGHLYRAYYRDVSGQISGRQVDFIVVTRDPDLNLE